MKKKKNKNVKPLPIHNEEGYHQSLFFLRLFCFVFFCFFLSNRAIRPLKTFTRCLDGRFFLRVFIYLYFFFFFLDSLTQKRAHTAAF